MKVFVMEHGKGQTTKLYRRQVVRWVWQDASQEIEFSDRYGRPVDAFNDPVSGEFSDGSGEKTS